MIKESIISPTVKRVVCTSRNFYCPCKEAALVSIVVSLPCTAYLCGTFIAWQISSEKVKILKSGATIVNKSQMKKACFQSGYANTELLI